jgi:hypothetical protein
MPNKVEIRNGQAKFDLNIDADVREYFVDGLGQLMIGANISKILFYTSWGDDGTGVEERLANVRISIPTAALIDLARQIVDNTTSHQDFIVNELGNLQNAVREKLKAWSPNNIEKPD